MPHLIDTNPLYDPKIMQIAFSEGPEFAMEIYTYNKFDESDIKKRIRLFLAIAASGMEGPNPDVQIKSTAKAIKLIGNIFNALELLKDKEIISQELYSAINADGKVQEIIQGSKQYVDEVGQKMLMDAVAHAISMANTREYAISDVSSTNGHNKTNNASVVISKMFSGESKEQPTLPIQGATHRNGVRSPKNK